LKKQTRRKLLAVVLVAAATMAGAKGANANFADDWLSQTSGSAPGYFQGSQRGYYTGGSFSARWPQSNDSLLTISKPSLKSGCGGIDMFLGGMSLMNVDYLVDKLQRILSAAPAAAFDIALKTLAPQVSDTIKSLESIVDKLNNLQLDDCKAAKALVATVASPLNLPNAVNAEMTAATTDFMVTSGAGDLYNTITNTFKSEQSTGTGSATAKAAADASMAGCPVVLKTIFGGGSILEKLGEMKGIPDEHIATMRGYLGDVYVKTPSETGTTPIAQYIPPCGKSSYQGLIDGTAQVADENGVCSDSTDTNRNLVNYVASRMNSIATAIKNKSSLQTEDTQLLASIPLPIWPALRAAAQTNTESMVIGKLADVAAKGLAFQMITDMMSRMQQMQDYAQHAKTTQVGADGTPPETCELSMFTQPMEVLQEVVNASQNKNREAYQGFATAAANSASIDSLVASLEHFASVTRKGISARFSRGAAIRLVPGA